MANFEISDDPGLNISAVKEVVQSDKVIASLINQYFKIFLSNDQALKNLIENKTKIFVGTEETEIPFDSFLIVASKDLKKVYRVKHKTKTGLVESYDFSAKAKDIEEDAEHRFVSDRDKKNWTSKLDTTGNSGNTTVEIKAASKRESLGSGGNLRIVLGKIEKWYQDFKNICWSGSYEDLIDKPDIPSGDAANLSVTRDDTTNSEKYVPTSEVTFRHGKEIDGIVDKLTVDGKVFVYDFQDGKYGYNTDPARGADTFVPFSRYSDGFNDALQSIEYGGTVSVGKSFSYTAEKNTFFTFTVKLENGSNGAINYETGQTWGPDDAIGTSNSVSTNGEILQKSSWNVEKKGKNNGDYGQTVTGSLKLKKGEYINFSSRTWGYQSDNQGSGSGSYTKVFFGDVAMT